MDYAKESLRLHKEWGGKIEVVTTCPLNTREDLSLAYTPGVAEPCLAIQKDYKLSWDLTRRHNLVAVITDGTAVLGLGDIGPAAGMPVMEGKCALFKGFGDVDAIPICVDTKDVDEFVRTVYLISKSFGGINLEDISGPRCFEIEEKLKAICDIPIFHDDQHGTAIVTSAALLNALKVTGKKMGELKIVFNGAGAAGIAIAKLMIGMGFGSVTLCDSKGIICEGDPRIANNAAKVEMSKITNREHLQGTLADAVKGADVFVGVSKPKCLTGDMIKTMNKDSIIFALANPTPEIFPDEAKEAGAAVVGTGRSDFANQINNVLVFPGLFKGALSVKAKQITESMKYAAAYALAGYVKEDELDAEHILPSALDKNVAACIAKAVAEQAIKDGNVRE